MKTEIKESWCELMKESFNKLETEILQLICKAQKDEACGKQASLWSVQIVLEHLSRKIERIAKLQRAEDFLS